MSVKLLFKAKADGDSAVEMQLGSSKKVTFSYVDFVKYLYENKNAAIDCEFADEYDEGQRAKLIEMASKIKAACGAGNDDADVDADGAELEPNPPVEPNESLDS